MPRRVVHFEIPYDDADRASTFYRDVFAWGLETWPDAGGYVLASTGPNGDRGPTEPGFINGGLQHRSEGHAAPNVVIDVDDIDAALDAVEGAGGKRVQGRQPVGDMGWGAYFTDSEGNVVGLWETKNP
jgi:predicted enzyme related to lactoylglutathione lyase